MDESDLNLEISDAAAMLFWASVSSRGFSRTVADVRSSNGHCLMRLEDARQILASYRFTQLPESEVLRSFDAVCDLAHESTIREENLQGVVYEEDAATGRSPSCRNLDVSDLCARPPAVHGNEPVEKAGALCLRHPLPAVVFANALPRAGFIQVASTALALGVEYPLFLMRTGETAMPGGLYALAGVFQIPVPDEETGDRWAGVIQNSMGVIGSVGVQTREGIRPIEFGWNVSGIR
jgi:hypothetical protein